MVEKGPVIIGTRQNCKPLERENRGNWLHATAARRILGNSTEYWTGQLWNQSQLEAIQSHSHIVLVMANAIRLGFKDAPFPWHQIAYENISKSNLPTVVFGLGAQGPLLGDVDYSIPQETLRLLHLLQERSKKIAVRGAFTAEVLKRNGVKNAEVVGCQSCFWNLNATFPFKLERPQSQHAKICFNYTSAVVEAEIIELGVRNGYSLIGQSEFFEEHAQLGVPFDEPTQLTEIFKRGHISKEAYISFCQTNFRQFTNVYDWMDFIKQFDFSFGTRFHGNMVALQSGIPALWIIHDSRTKELCEFFELPHITLQEALTGLSLPRLLDRVDYSNFLKVYPDRYARFKNYVENAGLKHVLV
jgi:hypothetical protein